LLKLQKNARGFPLSGIFYFLSKYQAQVFAFKRYAAANRNIKISILPRKKAPANLKIFCANLKSYANLA